MLLSCGNMQNIDLYKEPLQIESELKKDIAYEAEMTEWELAFLCGLIKKYKPKKLLEIGVAAGGTTAILLNCLDCLNLKSEFYSVDYSKKFYRDPKYNTGFWLKQY